MSIVFSYQKGRRRDMSIVFMQFLSHMYHLKNRVIDDDCMRPTPMPSLDKIIYYITSKGKKLWVYIFIADLTKN